MIHEKQFTCPYCWEEITMLLDATGGAQSYVEDCEVCCNPIAISYMVDSSDIVEFNADSLEQ